MNNTNITTPEIIQDDFLLQKRKLHVEYEEKLKECEKSGESRNEIDQWYVKNFNDLETKRFKKTRVEDVSDSIKETANELLEKVEPVLDMIKDGVSKIEDIGVPKEKKQWNEEAKDVKYLETLRLN